MGFTDRLVEEHALLREAIAAREPLSRAVASWRATPPREVGELLEAIERWALDVHHRREEELLFPALAEAGVRDEAGPMGTLHKEHDQVRALLRVMRATLPRASTSDEARRSFVDAADYCHDLVWRHLQKEEQVLFRIAVQALDAPAMAALDEAFERDRREGEDELRARVRSLLLALGAFLEHAPPTSQGPPAGRQI